MILDTCALLWLAVDQTQLSQPTLQAIEDSKALAVSSISAFEIGQKYKRGQLELSLPPKSWFERAITKHRLTAIDLSPDICFSATELPKIHKDPFDRLIIATAIAKNCPVVTTDTVFGKYGIKTLS